jgi:hypothetical protein
MKPGDQELEAQFHRAILNMYERACREYKLNATRFLLLIGKLGGLTVAKRLINTPVFLDSLIELRKRGRLDISMEAMILKDTWKDLFTEEERDIARKRLRELGYRA